VIYNKEAKKEFDKGMSLDKTLKPIVGKVPILVLPKPSGHLPQNVLTKDVYGKFVDESGLEFICDAEIVVVKYDLFMNIWNTYFSQAQQIDIALKMKYTQKVTIQEKGSKKK
jgi:hypothetical protein